ncbi:MAG: thiamine phosphate synthase, partial [Acidobacteria bacterium]|nr:thiamine phosphate synthase [Acidobacteriota bacterium]
DYVAIGPIFSTLTKQAAEAPIGLEGLRLVRDEVRQIPLVAIGGITLDSSLEVLTAGADALALISGIWNPPGTAAIRTKRFLQGR